MKCAITVTILFILSTLSFAQVNNLHLTLRNGVTISQSSIEKLIENSVKISSSGQSQWIKVDSIIEIRQIKKSKFWQGAGIGLLGGAVIGGVIAKVTYKKPDPSPDSFNLDFSGLNTFGGVILGGVAGSLLGGIIGSSVGRDEIYDLSQKKLEQKLKMIQSIISKKSKD